MEQKNISAFSMTSRGVEKNGTGSPRSAMPPPCGRFWLLCGFCCANFLVLVAKLSPNLGGNLGFLASGLGDCLSSADASGICSSEKSHRGT